MPDPFELSPEQWKRLRLGKCCKHCGKTIEDIGEACGVLTSTGGVVEEIPYCSVECMSCEWQP